MWGPSQLAFDEGSPVPEPLDAAGIDAVAAAFAPRIASCGGVHILVCSAGQSHPAYLSATPMAMFDQLYRANCMGTVAAVYACLPTMRAQRCGRIVLVSSVVANCAITGFAA